MDKRLGVQELGGGGGGGIRVEAPVCSYFYYY